ncbi:MGMT family protein [Aeromonas dhakensis]
MRHPLRRDPQLRRHRPCHRVIGQNGSLTGYAGGLEIKKALLQLENISER